MGYWQVAKQVTVPNGGGSTAVSVPMPSGGQPRSRLTMWAVSGARPLTNMTFQPQINAQNYGAASTVTAAVAIKVIFSSGGATANNDMLPFVPNNADALAASGLDPFSLSVLITNNGAAPETVTIYAVALTPN